MAIQQAARLSSLATNYASSDDTHVINNRTSSGHFARLSMLIMQPSCKPHYASCSFFSQSVCLSVHQSDWLL